MCVFIFILMQPCLGVKGLTALHILPTFDVVNGMVIDYMHCILEGIGKKLVSLWFSDTGNPYYIKSYAGLVDERLLAIKPPDCITRTPRALSTRKHWKGYVYFSSYMHSNGIMVKFRPSSPCM